MEISNFKKDIAKIETGEWVSDIPNMGNLRLRVRGISSKLYTTKLSRLQRAVPSGDRDRSGSILPDVGLRLMGEAAHEVLLLEWDGLEDNGKPFAYDSAVAFQWLTDPEYSQFLDAVIWASNVVDNGKAATKDTTTKN